MHFVDVGFSNFVETKKIIGISKPEAAPIRRLVQKAKEEGRFHDYTQGKKTRSIIYSTCGDNVVLTASSILTTTVIDRINRAKKAAQVKEAVSEDIIEVSVAR